MEEGDERLNEMEIVMQTGEPTKVEVCKDTEEGLEPIISLHAFLGTGDSQTMKLQGKVKNLVVIILVDIGSTHNFINQNVVKRGRFIHRKSLILVCRWLMETEYG